jgi:hypothetical protein
MSHDEQPVIANLTHKEINTCSFDQWFPLFDTKRPRVTIRSKIIPLSDDFISYLHEDGVVLPKSIVTRKYEANFSDDDEEEDQEHEEFAHEFPEIQESIANAIEEYDGAVFPKLNWSSPRDAQWILSDSKLLKCTHVEDVFLVLKSSQFITHDLDDAYKNVKQDDQEENLRPVLVLRKWYDIHPSMEFRCFVRNKQLVAISQRDETNFYDFLVEKKNELRDKITDFWHQHVEQVFPLENYTMDVYVARTGPVFIIDFNVYGPPTQSFLFDWAQKPLNNDEYQQDTTAEIRTLESHSSAIRPSLQTYGGVPSDFFDPDNVEKMMNFMEKQRNEED